MSGKWDIFKIKVEIDGLLYHNKDKPMEVPTEHAFWSGKMLENPYLLCSRWRIPDAMGTSSCCHRLIRNEKSCLKERKGHKWSSACSTKWTRSFLTIHTSSCKIIWGNLNLNLVTSLTHSVVMELYYSYQLVSSFVFRFSFSSFHKYSK